MTLRIVHPLDVGAGSTAVDIVAVHGLGGDPYDTWKLPKSKAIWIKDFLPQKIPDARIMTFGYNADAAFGQSTADIIDHAKSLLSGLKDKREEAEQEHRPLVFISHSLGGIVVKQALLQARLEPQYNSIRDATLGVIFFGTPHRGRDKATYGKVLASVAKTVTLQSGPRLLTALETNSGVLLRLTADFRFQLSQCRIFSFYEQRPVRPFSSLIIEKHSALLETEHEDQIPVDADHRAMCKFATSDDDIFEKVYIRIQRMRKTAQPRSGGQITAYNQHYLVPHVLSPAYTGQGQVSKALEASLLSNDDPHPVQRRFVLFGLGGSGKTQICINYAQSHRGKYWAVFWIDASTTDSIKRDFLQIALALHVDQDIDTVKRTIANELRPWLLIYDNADDPDLSLAPYFSPADRGHIIVTSRNPECQHYSTVGCQEIGRMSLEDSLSLLFKTTYGNTAIDDNEIKAGQEVVETLGRLALAVAHAGVYIREVACSLEEYLIIHERYRKDVMEFFPKHNGTDYRYTVYTTWQTSIDRIESMQTRTSNNALRLLRLLCFYHHDQIPIQMFYNAWQNSTENHAAPSHSPWPETASNFFDYQKMVQALVALLVSFSLVSRNSDSSLTLHPLVHDWCRRQASDKQQQVECQRAISLLVTSTRWEYNTEDYAFRRSLVSHVLACLRVYDCKDEDFDSNVMRHWPMMGLILRESGLVWDAFQLAEQVVRIEKEKLGEDHPMTIESTLTLATCYSEIGYWREAKQLSEQVVQMGKEKLKDYHPNTMLSMHNLAINYSKVGRQMEALQLSEHVLQLRQEKLGKDHPDTIRSMDLLERLSKPANQNPPQQQPQRPKHKPQHKLSRLLEQLRL